MDRVGARKPTRSEAAKLRRMKRQTTNAVNSRHAGRLHIVLDNVGSHGTAEVLAWAKAHNVRFCCTPTNASWLNRIECHFAALRRFALDNSDFRSHAEQQEAIEEYLAWRNRKRPISKEAWKAPSCLSIGRCA